MVAQLLDGKHLATQLRKKMKVAVQALKSQTQVSPTLAVILVGNDPASSIYVQHKQAACQEVGILSVFHHLPDATTQQALESLLFQLNEDASIDGILVQLPLPKQINTQAIISHINPAKDVDGFHPLNVGKLALKMPSFRPCTPYGIVTLLKHYNIDPKGLNALVIGTSNIVGLPMTLELLQLGATVTTCHRHTKNLKAFVERAELLICAVGKPGLIKGTWIKPGCVVIDVGINRLDDGKLVGDVEFAPAFERASWITPVPGGVGPMTVTQLLQNTLLASTLKGELLT